MCESPAKRSDVCRETVRMLRHYRSEKFTLQEDDSRTKEIPYIYFPREETPKGTVTLWQDITSEWYRERLQNCNENFDILLLFLEVLFDSLYRFYTGFLKELKIKESVVERSNAMRLRHTNPLYAR